MQENARNQAICSIPLFEPIIPLLMSLGCKPSTTATSNRSDCLPRLSGRRHRVELVAAGIHGEMPMRIVSSLSTWIVPAETAKNRFRLEQRSGTARTESWISPVTLWSGLAIGTQVVIMRALQWLTRQARAPALRRFAVVGEWGSVLRSCAPLLETTWDLRQLPTGSASAVRGTKASAGATTQNARSARGIYRNSHTGNSSSACSGPRRPCVPQVLRSLARAAPRPCSSSGELAPMCPAREGAVRQLESLRSFGDAIIA